LIPSVLLWPCDIACRNPIFWDPTGMGSAPLADPLVQPVTVTRSCASLPLNSTILCAAGFVAMDPRPPRPCPRLSCSRLVYHSFRVRGLYLQSICKFYLRDCFASIS
jgi:hypothetical protein